MNKLIFSGHESFNCRPLWLKKGYDFIQKGLDFNQEDAVVELGVGKNMVNSIKFWTKSFGLTKDENILSDFANYIFGANGRDKYLENPATLWLLHYHLIKVNHASIYSLFFNDFRKHSQEFTKERLERYLIRYSTEQNSPQSENTIERDVRIFLKNYGRPSNKTKDIEDEFSNIFIDLNLLEKVDLKTFRIVNKERKEIPHEVVLFLILDKYGDRKSISFHNLLNGENSVGNVLVINQHGILNKIEEIVSHYNTIVFSDVAGIKELQFKRNLDKWEVLNKYYEK